MQVQDIINGALRFIGVIAAGELAAPEELADGLISLNEMLASWETERLEVYAIQKSLFNLVNGQQSYTVGVGGNLNMSRPLSIKNAAIITGSGGFSIPLEVIPSEEWAGITEKSITGQVPRKLYADFQYPLSTFYFWPIPGVPTPQLDLYTWVQLGQFVALTDTFDFPPGYELAIRSNLGIVMAPEYGRQVSQELIAIAQNGKDNLKAINQPPVPGQAEEGAARARAAQSMAGAPPPGATIAPGGAPQGRG